MLVLPFNYQEITSCQIFFIFVAPTAPPDNFTIEVINSTTLELSWDPPPADQQNGAITNYTVSCNELVGGSSSLVTTIEFPRVIAENGSVYLILEGFRPGTPITCTVSASNFAGTGPVATRTQTTLEERKLFQLVF